MTTKLSDKQKLTLWFVRLRWTALAMMLIILLISFYLGKLRIPLLPPLIIISLAALYNFLFPFFIYRFPKFSEIPFFTCLRSTLDVLVITLLVHFTGGVESPFTPFYLLELVAVSIGGYKAIAYILALQSSLLYLANGLMEILFLINHYRLVKLPGTLYLSTDYVISKSLALFFTAVLITHLASFLAEKLKEKQQQVIDLSKAQLDFTNMVVHELKSPLTSVMGYSDLLMSETSGTLNEKQKSFLNIIKNQSARILKLVTDLLDLSRLEMGFAKIEKKKTNLVDLATRIAEEMQPELEKKKIVLVKEFDSEIPQTEIDEEKIGEVITNLLSNAIKFSEEGGKIFFTISLHKNEILVSIRDEGLGIDPHDLPHIFEKFYRASKEAAERKGSGLGLTITKIIVEAHGGKIWAASAGKNQGAVFYFTLPL